MIKLKLDRRRLSSRSLLVLGACLVGLFTACRTEERFLTLENNFAGPVDVIHAGSYFYVLNSDFDRRYDQGSIIVLDPDAEEGAEKLAVVKTPRMGRSLHQVGSWMIVGYDRPELEGDGRVELRSIEDDGLSLPVRAAWDIPCSPINAMISPNERYIAVSCIGGDLWAGRLNTAAPEQSNIQHVRSYGVTRRALYFYETDSQSILFAFPTDIAEPRLADLSAFDRLSYNPANAINDDGTLELDEGPNEVPDVLETELADIRRPDRRLPYQMAIYDLQAAEAEGFPLILNGTVGSPTQADRERKFIYFTLKNLEENWENDDQWNNPERKYYRTNFWAARPDPKGDETVFYLSHRGFTDSPFANNILRVKINPDALTDTSQLPESSDILWYERVYGFSGENPDLKNYPGDFEFAHVGQDDILLVNHFRDAVYWDPYLQKFSIAFKRLGSSPSETPPDEEVGIGFGQSYYQLAVNAQGTVVSGSFYGDSVMILDVTRNGVTLRKQLY
ncbi:MAG: hypothetical protein ACOH5I_23795 [Oligoflexus sp.]